MDLTGYHSGQGERKVRRQKGTGMEQKRYESDMTPKEKRELERKKLKQMTAGQKLEYIWAYYKPHMAVALGIILLIVFIGVSSIQFFMQLSLTEQPETERRLQKILKIIPVTQINIMNILLIIPCI